MNVKQEPTCILCLKVIQRQCKNNVDETVRLMLDILLLKFDVDITRDPIVCQDCVEVAKKCLDFKYTCANTERVILSSSVVMKKAKLDIRVIYKEGVDIEAVVDENLNICRFCMTQSGRHHFVSLAFLMNDAVSEVLSGYFPEMVHRVCSIINMDVKKQQVCRLCLKLARDEYWEINELFKQIFDTLLLDLDLDITRDPIACQDCVEVAKNCLRFKYVCIGTEKIILSFCHDKKEIKYNIKIIYEGSKDICRFCMVPLKRNKFVSLDTFMNETRCEVLSKYMPEMDFNIIENPMICTSCRKKVNSFLKFVLNCVGTEEKVKAYCKEGGSNSRGQLKLDNIPHFFIKNVLKYPENGPKVLAIKEKTNTFYNKGCVHSDFTSGSINLEDYEIKKDETNFEAKSFKNLKNRTSKSLSKDIPETQKFKCGSCSYETKLKSNLKSHMLVHRDVSQVQMLKCSFCSYESKRKSNLKIHMLIHDEFLEAKLYKCPLCTYEAKEKRKINRHMLVHKDVSEIKMHKCSLCDYEAKQKSYLKSHMLVHKDISEVQMYKCPLCTHETKHKGLIKKHMLVHKNVSELKMYKCSLCVYETKYKSALKTHTYVIHKGVSEIEMHKCSLCPYESKQKVSLKRHMLVHKDVSEMQMYKCSLCPYEAKHKGYLRRHMSVHKDDAERKMYKCLLCSYEAKQNSSLNKHMSLHMDFSEIKI